MIEQRYEKNEHANDWSRQYIDNLAQAFELSGSVSKMMLDGDVASLPQSLRSSLEKAARIISSFPTVGKATIAIFGDAEEGAGEVTLLELSSRKQVHLTMETDGRITFVLSSRTNRYQYQLDSVDNIARFSQVFFDLG